MIRMAVVVDCLVPDYCRRRHQSLPSTDPRSQEWSHFAASPYSIGDPWLGSDHRPRPSELFEEI